MGIAREGRIGIRSYKGLGLIANPFKDVRGREGETVAQSLEIQAAGNRMLARLDEIADTPKGRTLWVEKSDQVNTYYHRGALTYAEETLIRDEEFDVLSGYVQLFMAKIGRVRCVLHVVGERLATHSFDRTLAKWVEQILAEPDTELAEYEPVADGPLQEFAAAFEDDPVAAIEERFGKAELFRKIELQPPTDIRGVSLEEEPDETDEMDEDDAMTAQIPDYDGIDSSRTSTDEEEEVGPDPVVQYVIAYTKVHFSPVLARGLVQYYERGVGPLSEELKITRAPRKTLRALVRLATMRFRKVVIMYDGFDNWVFMPEELRIKFVTALIEMRMNLGTGAVFVLFVTSNQADELEEHFGGGDRILWDFPNLRKIGELADELNIDVVRSWIEAARCDGADELSLTEGPLFELVERADGSMASFCAMASAAVDDAARRGLSALDEATVVAGVAAARKD